RQELHDPLGSRETDTLAVVVEQPSPRAVQIVTVAHHGPPEPAVYDLYTSTIVFAGGRILELMWVRVGPFSVEALARLRDDMRRWAAAVIAANP
ncbi:MAG TPA: hypothetical protein VLV15_01580, partial [Dongiaceae bacterium]|nr:hypothetical protein [Dongiaceae bacterium]